MVERELAFRPGPIENRGEREKLKGKGERGEREREERDGGKEEREESGVCVCE